MGYMIEISESKLGTLAENAEKMLRYGGKVMQCIDELSHGRMNERDEEYWERDDMNDRMNERYMDERYGGYDERYPRMNMRRSSRTGRYIR